MASWPAWIGAGATGFLGAVGMHLYDRAVDDTAAVVGDAAISMAVAVYAMFEGLQSGEVDLSTEAGTKAVSGSEVDAFRVTRTETLFNEDPDETDVTLFVCADVPSSEAAARAVAERLSGKRYGSAKLSFIEPSEGARALFADKITLVYDVGGSGEKTLVPDLASLIWSAVPDARLHAIANAGISTPWRLNVFFC